MNRADAYLAIPKDYTGPLGGLRWHPDGEAIEFAAEGPKVGLTFAMAPALADFLEGFATGRDLVSFGHVLHMMALLGCGRFEAEDPAITERNSLPAAFRALGQPLRNAGALFATLVPSVPAAADPPDVGDMRAILTYGYAGMFAGPEARGEAPPLSFAAFDRIARAALANLPADALDHWLRFGCAPLGDAGEEVARAAEAARPRSLSALLDALDGRERLAGATRLVALLDGALSLPPRRLAPAELPTGGFADVATRGLPEQILPAQFALDDLEFLRRFAERELLYYHREEPRTPRAEELLVVLDQGVRTWGDARLVLTAAAIALGRQAARRRFNWLVATTADDGTIVDPTALADPDSLGSLLEASDLSINPGLALERVLETPSDRPRDVVLLTHPRSLDEPDVAAAARRAGPNTRLFAVAVDAEGRVGFAEMRRGAPVTIARCRVELRRDPEPVPAPGRVEPDGSWAGDVETIGFPFTLGVLGPVQDGHFDFDERGEWLLVADRQGLLHAWRVDGTTAAMLPRGMLHGTVLSQVEAVVGVAGGFVVAGSLGHLERAALFHYDFRTRKCVGRSLNAWRGAREWFYLRDFHAIALRDPADPGRNLALDLGTGDLSASESLDPSSPRKEHPNERAALARQAAFAGPTDRPSVFHDPGDGRPGLFARLETKGGWIRIWRQVAGDPTLNLFVGDGPGLANTFLRAVRLAGGTLALSVLDVSKRRLGLRLLELPGGRLLSEYSLPNSEAFALSRDGRRLARRVDGPAIEVRDVGGSSVPLMVTPVGKTHSSIDVELGRDCLALRGGRVTHVLSWFEGPLQVDRVQRRRGEPGDHDLPLLVGSEETVAAESPWRYGVDGRRFVAGGTRGGLTVLTDVFGHVAVLGEGNRLAAMFFVFREKLAGWLPDGTRFGPPSVIGGPESQGALARFGLALRTASAARREGARLP